MLKTAATRMYWKQDTRNNTEFSKFLDSNLFPSSAGSGFGGGEYLVYFSFTLLHLKQKTDSPVLPSDPQISPELNRACNDYLPNDA